jgi:hypothetical protein
MNQRLSDPARRQQLVDALRELEADTSPDGRRLWMGFVYLLSAQNALARGDPEGCRAKTAEVAAILGDVAPVEAEPVEQHQAPQPQPVKVTEHG